MDKTSRSGEISRDRSKTIPEQISRHYARVTDFRKDIIPFAIPQSMKRCESKANQENKLSK